MTLQSFCSELSNEDNKIEEIDISEFTSFLEEVKPVYQNGDQTLRTALNKFKDHYNAAKLESIPRLSSYLYVLNRDLDPMVAIKGGAHIRVQVESIKRHKIGGGSAKRRLPGSKDEGNENLDPQAIPSRKKRKTGKKEHNL